MINNTEEISFFFFFPVPPLLPKIGRNNVRAQRKLLANSYNGMKQTRNSDLNEALLSIFRDCRVQEKVTRVQKGDLFWKRHSLSLPVSMKRTHPYSWSNTVSTTMPQVSFLYQWLPNIFMTRRKDTISQYPHAVTLKHAKDLWPKIQAVCPTLPTAMSCSVFSDPAPKTGLSWTPSPLGAGTQYLKPLNYCLLLWLAHHKSMHKIFIFSFFFVPKLLEERGTPCSERETITRN